MAEHQLQSKVLTVGALLPAPAFGPSRHGVQFGQITLSSGTGWNTCAFQALARAGQRLFNQLGTRQPGSELSGKGHNLLA